MKLIETSLQIALRGYPLRGRDTYPHGGYCEAYPERSGVVGRRGLPSYMMSSKISDITAEDLLAEGIPAEMVEAVQSLTKQGIATSQRTLLATLAQARTLATGASAVECRCDMWVKVKIADIEDNIDVLRLTSLDEHDLARIKRYHSAWRFLKETLR